MSEEKTQIFRGDEPPEMAMADTTPIARKKRTDGPVDQRGLIDQKDGEHFERSMRDASGGPGDQRRTDDADGLSELRQLHGKAAGEGAAALHDGDGPSDLRQMHDAGHAAGDTAMHDGDGPSDQRRMNDAEGLSDQRGMNDADGLSDQRQMEDADGLSDQRRMEDAEGLSDLREMRDHHALIPDGGTDDADSDAEDAEAGAAAATTESEAEPEKMSDPDLTFEAEDDATPWALSIHLEERIASLGVTTTKVNRQLDVLDESILRLAKRIAK